MQHDALSSFSYVVRAFSTTVVYICVVGGAARRSICVAAQQHARRACYGGDVAEGFFLDPVVPTPWGGDVLPAELLHDAAQTRPGMRLRA
jgi:hypothetical protein